MDVASPIVRVIDGPVIFVISATVSQVSPGAAALSCRKVLQALIASVMLFVLVVVNDEVEPTPVCFAFAVLCLRWGQIAFYKEHPYLSEEAAAWLVRRGVKLLGMDSPTPDDPRSGPNNPQDSPNHQILLGAGVILVEYLCNLSALTQSEVELIVLPLKLKGADGSPVRCVAIEHFDVSDERTDT